MKQAKESSIHQGRMPFLHGPKAGAPHSQRQPHAGRVLAERGQRPQHARDAAACHRTAAPGCRPRALAADSGGSLGPRGRAPHGGSGGTVEGGEEGGRRAVAQRGQAVQQRGQGVGGRAAYGCGRT